MNSALKVAFRCFLAMCFASNAATAYDFSKKTTVTVFKCFGKYPYALKLNQFSNEVDLILYGCIDSNGKIGVVSSVHDYANLVPVQIKMGNPDNGIKIEKTYSGYNETYLMRFADSTLRLIGLLPNEDYKKDFKDSFLMSEYKKGRPIKLVLPNLEYFNVIRDYLLTQIESENAVHPIYKPLLFIELEDGNTVDQGDLDLLGNYFDVTGPRDEEAVIFFEKNEKKIDKIIARFKDFYQVGQSLGEMIMQVFDRDFEKGDVKKLMVKYSKFVILGITFLFLEDTLKEKVVKPTRQLVGDSAGRFKDWVFNMVQYSRGTPKPGGEY